MTTTMTRREAEDVALLASQRIVDCIGGLPRHIRELLPSFLANDPSDVLSSIGMALLDEDPVPLLGKLLLADVFIGDGELVVDRLGDAEPWSTIRVSLREIIDAWRAAHPGLRTAVDRGTWQRARRRRRTWP